LSKQFIKSQPVAKAEIMLLLELNWRGIYPLTQQWFEFQFQWEAILGKKVDFLFKAEIFRLTQPLVVELDGPHHQKLRQEEHDELTDAAFKRRNIAVMHIPYDGVPSWPKAREWADSVMAELEKLRL